MPLLSAHLTHRPVPPWLDDLHLCAVPDLETVPLPLAEMLADAVYYPAAGQHGGPVKWLAGAAHSFIYADYGVGLAAARAAAEKGFDGYSLIGLAEITQEQLTPRGWAPSIEVRPSPHDLERFGRIVDELPPPFALWSVYERFSAKEEAHGPRRFSLLFVGGDGVATYDALFRGHRVAPRFLFLIRPGTGFGLNYTDFLDENGLFARVVTHGAPVLPRYLVTFDAAPGGGSWWPGRYPDAVPTVAYRLWEGR